METTINLIAILIDAKNKEIKEITFDSLKGFDDIRPLMGEGCRLLEAISYVNQWDLVMGDEEAYYNEYEHGFVLDGFGYIHGNGVVIGSDDSGEDASTFFGVSKVQELVKFPTKEEVQRQLEWFRNNGGIQVVSW
jgi:hypothetical protein